MVKEFHQSSVSESLLYNLRLNNVIDWVVIVEIVNPYHAEGYLWLVPNHSKCDYSHDWSKCSTMPSVTIVNGSYISS